MCLQSGLTRFGLVRLQRVSDGREDPWRREWEWMLFPFSSSAVPCSFLFLLYPSRSRKVLPFPFFTSSYTQLNRTQLPPPNLIIPRYFAELLAERQKLVPFVQILPQCTKLLTQGMRHSYSHSNTSFPLLLSFHQLLLFLILY